MKFLGLPPLSVTVATVASAALVIVLYTVRWRLPRRMVSTTIFWLASAVRRRGYGRLGRLENLVSLALQLTIVLGLILGLGRPRFGCQSPAGQAVLLVLDRSPSMGAVERVEPRLAAAKRTAHARLRAVAGVDRVGVILAGGEPEIAAPLAADLQAAHKAVDAAKLRGPGSLPRAVALGCDLLRGSSSARLLIVTDGSEDLGSCSDPATQLEVVRMGAARANVGVTAFSTAITSRTPLEVDAFVEIFNSWTAAVDLELRIDSDDALKRLVEVHLEPGARDRRVVHGIAVGPRGRLVARLERIRFTDEARDVLSDDDRGFAVVTRPPVVPIDLVGQSEVVKLVLASNPAYAVRPATAVKGDVVTVISGPPPSALPPGRYLLLGPSGQFDPFFVDGKLTGPTVTWWNEQHPIMRRVVVADLAVSEALATRLPTGATPLISAGDRPLMFAVEDGARKMVATTFGPEDSNLPLRVGFPVLVYNAIDWLSRAPTPRADNGAIGVPTQVAVDVRGPDGVQRLEPLAGWVTLPGDRAGFYEVTAVDGKQLGTFAVQVADAGETALSPRADAKIPTTTWSALRDRDAGPFFLVIALVLLCLEWLTYHRRITV